MAGSLNKVMLIGHLGADPEIRRSQDGKPIANLSVATSETWRDRNSGEKREKTEWHKVVIFSEGLAGVAEKYLSKGAKVYIEGQLQTRKWTDQSGQDRYSTEVVLTGFGGTLVMLSSKDEDVGGRRNSRRDDRDDEYGGNSRGGRDDRGARDRANPRSQGHGGSAYSRDMDDDIPFAPEWRG